MATKVISFSLSESGLQKAIDEINRYAQELEEKCNRLCELVGSRIAWSASRGFSEALVGDVIKGNAPQSDVQVTVETSGNVTVVIADGNEALFIEFGAGVYNNGPVGSSPHPWGTYTIGSYGKGNGAKNVWGYYGDGGLVLTRGTPAAMPMYRGMQEAIAVLQDLVREVFG